MIIKLRHKKPRARVEMTPLMDVVFLLLIFFIYSMLTMTVQRALPLSLPVSGQAALTRETGLTLSISAGGALYLDKEPLGPDALVAALRARIEESGVENIVLQVFADGALSYQELYKALDLLKAAGVRKISLQARGSGEPPAP